jgi:hypothetical protein
LAAVENRFTIPGELPNLNDVINKSKIHWAAYSKIKKDATMLVRYAANKLPVYKNKIFLDITYYVRNKRKDMDNIAFAKKFILDGLVEAKKIKNDGWGEIAGWKENFKVDKKNPRIEVIIKGEEK